MPRPMYPVVNYLFRAELPAGERVYLIEDIESQVYTWVCSLTDRPLISFASVGEAINYWPIRNLEYLPF